VQQSIAPDALRLAQHRAFLRVSDPNSVSPSRPPRENAASSARKGRGKSLCRRRLAVLLSFLVLVVEPSPARANLVHCESLDGASTASLRMQLRILETFDMLQSALGEGRPASRIFYYPADASFGEAVFTLWTTVGAPRLQVVWASRGIIAANTADGVIRPRAARVPVSSLSVAVSPDLALRIHAHISSLLEGATAPPEVVYTHASPMVFLDYAASSRIEPRCGRIESVSSASEDISAPWLDIFAKLHREPGRRDDQTELVAEILRAHFEGRR
jgi:hypothetical protein